MYSKKEKRKTKRGHNLYLTIEGLQYKISSSFLSPILLSVPNKNLDGDLFILVRDVVKFQ